jgi:hypothetical protein
MTTFVIDAQVAAPTLPRSQALALVYESVHRGDRAGRFSTISAGCGSVARGKTAGGWRACSPDCDTSYEFPAVRIQRR